MNSEQRVLATLDLSLKNAFETLNKYSLWATTPEDSVTFNLVDAVPTLASKGTGIFLKPITIPSLASIRSTIFGVAGTNSYRPLYWNLNFLGTKGWSFDRYSASDNPVLSILVDQEIGSDADSVTINKRNFVENVFLGKYNLDENSAIALGDNFELTNNMLRARLNSIQLGKLGGTSSLFGTTLYLGGNANDLVALKFIHSVAGSITRNIVSLGRVASNYETSVLGGSLVVSNTFAKNFKQTIKNTSGIDLAHLLSAIYDESTGKYDLKMAGWLKGVNGFKSLTIGDVKNLVVSASESLKITAAGIEITSDDDSTVMHGTGELKIYGDSTTSVGSKTELDLGIVDDEGVMSKEIVIRAGSVEIPNLYVQKKANYHLSGVRHLSETGINPSVVYYPDSTAKTLSDNLYAFEYSKNIKSQVIETSNGSDFGNVISDASGDIKAYLARLVDAGIELLTADATFDSATNSTIVTSKFTKLDSVTGLSDIKPYVQNSQLKMVSTENGIYLFVREIVSGNNQYNVYYSVDGIAFSKLNSFAISNKYIYSVSIDFVTVGTVDYFWFTHSLPMSASTTYYSEYQFGYTYALFHLENNCSVVKAYSYNTEGKQTIAGDGNVGGVAGNMFGLCGASHKVVASFDATSGSSYATMLGVFGGSWRVVTHKKDVFAYLGGGVGDLTGDTTYRAHGLFMRKFSVKSNYISANDILSFNLDDTNSTGFLVDGSISDFAWDGSVGYAIVTSATSTKKVKFNSTTELKSETVQITDGFTRYSQLLSTVSNVKLMNKIIVNISDATKAFTALNDVNYAINSILVEDSYSSPLSTLGMIGYEWSSDSIKYYDLGSGGVPVDLLEILVDKSNSNDDYDLKGSIVDYIGVNYVEYGSFLTGFLLSSVEGADFSLNANRQLTDRKVFVESDSGDVTTIIESSQSVFSPTKLSSVISTTYDKSKTILVSASNVFNPSGKIVEKSPVATATSPSSAIGALNFHIEPISYLVKNRNLSFDALSIGNYSIVKVNSNLYTIQLSQNEFSGYRIPYTRYDGSAYSMVSSSQINHSNQSSSAPESADMNSSKNMFYATIDGTHCHIHNNLAITGSTIIVSIPFEMIDPTDSAFDPSCAVVNEFSNVVSIKLPYMTAIRSKNCGILTSKGKANLVLGLTEISEIGGGC